jgi:signal peptidase I
MILRWLLSKTLRDAGALRKHVLRLLNAQRDLLTPAANQLVQGALLDLQDAINDRLDKKELRKQMEKLEQVAGKWLRPYPHAAWRENVEVLLVALAVAMAIRTFFLQPFKIPTGSMQPTLYGVTSKNLIANKDFQIPTGWARVRDWFHGISYVHMVAQNDGTIDGLSPMRGFLIFNIKQAISIGGVEHTIWFPPDMGEAPPGMDPLAFRAGLTREHVYHKGDDVIKLEVHAGDHLFVDRLTYNFRKPRRGEIIVFETAGIPQEEREAQYPPIPANEFYIKRLVGLGGETISLKKDFDVTNVLTFNGATIPVGHLVVNGQSLSAATPHFENLYSFSGVPDGTRTLQYQDNQYFGHAMVRRLAPGQQFKIGLDQYFAMGDNTFNSSDSRYWGTFQASDVIGKSFFVYWPLTTGSNGRFGIGHSVTAQ